MGLSFGMIVGIVVVALVIVSLAVVLAYLDAGIGNEGDDQ